MENKRPGGEMRPERDDAPTRSQLMPFTGRWHELVDKPYFIPGVVVSAGMALLFSTRGDREAAFVVNYGGVPVGVPRYILVLALLILSAAAWVTYRIAGKAKAWWVMPAAAAFTAVLLASPVWPLTWNILDFGIKEYRSDGLLTSYIKMFFTAALREEVFKSFVIFIGAAIAIRMKHHLSTGGSMRQFAVLEPIDGILIGAASGIGFAFYETLFQYVPQALLNSKPLAQALYEHARELRVSVSLSQNVPWAVTVSELYGAIARKVGPAQAQALLNSLIAENQGASIQLLIPRLTKFGHGAYSGILGYFIGLAVMRPKGRVVTVLVGLAVATGIHAAWNTVGQEFGVPGQFAVMMLAFGGLVAAISKARAISPDRAGLLPSQIIDRAGGAWQRPTAPAATADANVPAAPAFATGRTPAAAVPQRSVTWDTAPEVRMLEVATVRLPLTLGATLLEVHVPGVRSLARDGVIGIVNANPADPTVLGLKNESELTWSAALPDGTLRTLAPGRSIQIVAGMRIQVGEHAAFVR